MASPVPIAPSGPRHVPAQRLPSPQSEEVGPQTLSMGLKVHYTFDRESRVNCLARHPNTLQVQTIPLDETTTIGIIDIRSCVYAITECSPELSASDLDYTVYAVDYSEYDTPLVGQGTLAAVMASMQPGPSSQQAPKMVTGRVTKNRLAVFGGSNRDTLEVKLKLSESTRRQPFQAAEAQQQQLSQSQQQNQQQQYTPVEQVLTPTGSAEWSSFIQANPQLGQPSQVSRVASPALSQGAPARGPRRDSFASQILPAPEPQRIAPAPQDPTTVPTKPPASSRPSSRASTRAPRKKKEPTGRPRGRPRGSGRRGNTEGNTSGYEDGTEGEDGPAKKRVKTVVVEKTTNNAFGSGPDSLRVAASTSGSLRTFRPIGMSVEGTTPNHLQEVPRAPTPVPNGASGSLGRGPRASLLKRGSSMMNNEMGASHTMGINHDMGLALSPNSQDERSPESMAAPTPAYSMDSPADIGSSPPAPLTNQYMRASPVSSPVLPPMPNMFSQDSMTDVGMLPEAMFQMPEPVQAREHVFKIQDGPNGLDMVDITTYNTPLPTSMPAGPADAVHAIERAICRPRPSRPSTGKKSRETSALPTVPTPPPTTDAIERTISPPIEQALPDENPEPPAGVLRNEALTTQSYTTPALPPLPMPAAAPTPADPAPPPKPAPKPRRDRKLARSASAGPLALPVPASEPAGPSGLSQSFTSVSDLPRSDALSSLRRSNSSGPLSLPTVPASDPVGPSSLSLKAMVPPSDSGVLQSDAIAPSSPPQTKWNKNFVKKNAIKQKLEEAIKNGEMPPYCSNCGAIETPTWRKIWSQPQEGTPPEPEFSGDPGRITAIEVTKRDDDNKPTAYRLIKKALEKTEPRDDWQEILVCNPCGIWLGKYHEHRPRERWDRDAARAGQERKRRNPNSNNNRSRKSRSKSDAQTGPTPEPNPTTDAPAPVDEDVAFQIAALVHLTTEATTTSQEEDAGRLSNAPGSRHSRGDGASAETTEADSAMGTTKRLLFPSPRKDNSPKVLGELAVNMVHVSEDRSLKTLVAIKENLPKGSAALKELDELEALFQSPARPSTPPPGAKGTAERGSVFKTPTRPTPSQRPITRSVSRSLRSQRSQRSIISPNVQAPGTPSKTPRKALFAPGSAGPRRSPRHHEQSFDSVNETPVTRTINQMLMSDPSGFLDGADNELDLGNLDRSQSDMLDFGHFLSTDAMMPSSSPQKNWSSVMDFDQGQFDWSQWDAGVAEMEQ